MTVTIQLPATTFTIEAGAFIRRDVRAGLDALGVRWTEHRSWLDSIFVIHGATHEQRAAIGRWILANRMATS